MGPEKPSGILLTSGKPFDLSGLQFPSVYREGLGEVVSKAPFVLFITKILQRFEETPRLAPAQDYGCTVDSLVSTRMSETSTPMGHLGEGGISAV